MPVRLNQNIRSFHHGFLKSVKLWSLAGVMIGATLSPAVADQGVTDLYQSVRGGKLYDSWFVTLKIKPPKTNHPAYPAEGNDKGKDTWRCKTCHGWDYKGAEGQYATGKHATGIVGIRPWQGKDPAKLVEIIRNQTHQYTPAMIPDDTAKQLAIFVTQGQIEMDEVIDRATKKSKGDPQKGAPFYQTICIVCHGSDGKKINMGTEKEPEYLGTAANDNPWEVLHKIRHGQPGHDMISVKAFSMQSQADILAYIQTLPEK